MRSFGLIGYPLGHSFSPAYFEEKFKDQDWEVYTQSKFTEIIISDNLRIIPPWKSNNNFNGVTIIIKDAVKSCTK